MSDTDLRPFGSRQTTSEWLQQGPTDNILLDCARAMGRLKETLGVCVKLKSDDIRALTQRVASMNALIQTIRNYVPIKNGSGDAADATTSGQFGTHDGTDTDSERLVAALRAFGVTVDDGDLDKSNKPWRSTQGAMNKWIQAVQGNQDTLSSELQQKSTRAQQSVGEYNQAVDICSGYIKKNGDINDNICSNLHQ